VTCPFSPGMPHGVSNVCETSSVLSHFILHRAHQATKMCTLPPNHYTHTPNNPHARTHTHTHTCTHTHTRSPLANVTEHETRMLRLRLGLYAINDDDAQMGAGKFPFISFILFCFDSGPRTSAPCRLTTSRRSWPRATARAAARGTRLRALTSDDAECEVGAGERVLREDTLLVWASGFCEGGGERGGKWERTAGGLHESRMP
jgi:hypothetical protein